MTFDQRVAALADFGFTPRQAAFVATVALHSGYCLRRQYAAFTQQRGGQNVIDFLERLVAERLARRFTYRQGRAHIYHLHAKPIYRAIEQTDNRNRRHTGPALVARKLMLLDLVLSDARRDWYATEADKVELFVNRLGVPAEALPKRVYRSPTDRARADTTRYCVQKLPA
jgi:hypothetical protein